jgi:hypothetical protein
MTHDEIERLYNVAVKHLRTAVEVGGMTVDTALADTIGHCSLGLAQIAKLEKEARTNYAGKEASLLDIPAFLDRSTWTTEQIKNNTDANRRIAEAERRKVEAARRERTKKVTKAQVKKLKRLGWSDYQAKTLKHREAEQEIKRQAGPQGRFAPKAPGAPAI